MISYVRKGSKSLKSVIPKSVASVLKLVDGNQMEWEIEAKAAVKFQVSLRKATANN